MYRCKMNGAKQENKRRQLYFDSGLPFFSGHTKIALSNKMLSFPLDWQVKVSEKLPQPPAWSSSLARCTQPENIALPFGNSLILFTFWTSNTVLGSLSAIGIWKIVWFFQKNQIQQTWKSASCLFGSNFSPTGFSWTNPCFPNTWFGYNSKSQKYPSFDDDSNL